MCELLREGPALRGVASDLQSNSRPTKNGAVGRPLPVAISDFLDEPEPASRSRLWKEILPLPRLDLVRVGRAVRVHPWARVANRTRSRPSLGGRPTFSSYASSVRESCYGVREISTSLAQDAPLNPFGDSLLTVHAAPIRA